MCRRKSLCCTPVVCFCLQLKVLLRVRSEIAMLCAPNLHIVSPSLCTKTGPPSLLHAPQALPYFMVRPMEDENSAICSQFENPESLNALLPQFEAAVESAMAASSGRAGGPSASPQRHGGSSGTSIGSSERRWGQQRVLARLEVVRGIPFYGYHGQEKLFVKVTDYNKLMLPQATE